MRKTERQSYGNESGLTVGEMLLGLGLFACVATLILVVLIPRIGDGDKGQSGAKRTNTATSRSDSSTAAGSSTRTSSGVLANVTAISAGEEHTCALLTDGTVWCWGWELSWTPVAVSTISNATAIDAGTSNTCALLSTGTVKCWDANLGAGTTDDIFYTPTTVSGISNAIQISVGGDSVGSSHSCALLSGGAVKCWGSNNDGQLGSGTTDDVSTPVHVSGISSATAISAGADYTCALLATGSVKCWGVNDDGQLGDGDVDYWNLQPVFVKGITNATAISAGEDSSCALQKTGGVKCWGRNDFGELGDGVANHVDTYWGSKNDVSNDVSRRAVSAKGITNASQVSAGEFTSCALLTTGGIKCWGENGSFQLGDGVANHGEKNVSTGWDISRRAVSVKGISTATGLSAGSRHTCALLNGGTVKCWGGNQFGQLGSETTEETSSTPVEVR